MPFSRTRPNLRAGLLMLGAVVFASPVFAQDASRDSSDQSDGFCSSAGCRWSAISAGVLIGTLTVAPANRAERMGSVTLPRASTSSAQVSPEDCAACKVNDRPFDVPPGLLDKLFSEFGVGRGANSRSKKGGANGQGENGNGLGDGNGGSSGGSTAGGNSGVGAGGSGGLGGTGTSVAAAAGSGAGVSAAVTAADVTVTPEPQTLALVATGLIVLVPVGKRIRRRR